MPTYEYECKKCSERLEVVQSFSDEPLKKHKGCGGALRKVFGSIGITFKGSGFYKTDSRSSSKSGSAAKSGSSSGADSASSSSSSADSASSSSSGSDGKSSSSSGGDGKSSDSKSSGGQSSSGKKDRGSSSPSSAAAS